MSVIQVSEILPPSKPLSFTLIPKPLRLGKFLDISPDIQILDISLRLGVSFGRLGLNSGGCDDLVSFDSYPLVRELSVLSEYPDLARP